MPFEIVRRTTTRGLGLPTARMVKSTVLLNKPAQQLLLRAGKSFLVLADYDNDVIAICGFPVSPDSMSTCKISRSGALGMLRRPLAEMGLRPGQTVTLVPTEDQVDILVGEGTQRRKIAALIQVSNKEQAG